MTNFHSWHRFNRYDNSIDELSFAKLIKNNFASLSLQGGSTNRKLVEEIAERASLRIPVESLPDALSQTALLRGRTVFGCPGDYFDLVARSYPDMQWWLTENGLNMAVVPDLYTRLATRLSELENVQPQQRGFDFEVFLDALFAVFELSPRGSFRLVGEQIDGSFVLNDSTYLVEAKWQRTPIGNRELQSFAGTIRTKADWTRGLYVTNSGYSDDGLTAFSRGANTQVICLSGVDLRDMFTHNFSLIKVLDLKTRRAGETGRAYVSVRELFDIR